MRAMEAAIDDLLRALEPSGLLHLQLPPERAALEVELEVVDEGGPAADEPWFDTRATVVVITDDAYQLDRTPRRDSVIRVVGE